MSLLSVVCCGRANEKPEEDFWKWFKSNEAMLFEFEKNQEQAFRQLAERLHRLNPDLTFEFGPVENGKREFVISADGIREAFPEVERLYAAAPSMPRWKFTKFRPRRKPVDINYQGVSVRVASITVQLVRDGQLADLTVFVPNYSAAKRDSFTAIAFLLLDSALGEYDVETRVGRVQVEAPRSTEAHQCSLEDLPRVFDALLVK